MLDENSTSPELDPHFEGQQCDNTLCGFCNASQNEDQEVLDAYTEGSSIKLKL